MQNTMKKYERIYHFSCMPKNIKEKENADFNFVKEYS